MALVKRTNGTERKGTERFDGDTELVCFLGLMSLSLEKHSKLLLLHWTTILVPMILHIGVLGCMVFLCAFQIYLSLFGRKYGFQSVLCVKFNGMPIFKIRLFPSSHQKLAICSRINVTPCSNESICRSKMPYVLSNHSFWRETLYSIKRHITLFYFVSQLFTLCEIFVFAKFKIDDILCEKANVTQTFRGNSKRKTVLPYKMRFKVRFVNTE